MPTGATGQLGLALPVQGELSGTWGDTVNNGITQYTNIAIAATLTLTNDGAVTLANTTGDATASNITSSLTGAGTVTAQFAIVRVTGTLTTAKVVTAPSYSKTYTVVNAATGGIVTFKASGQTGVSIAVGESAFVYFNGTDYVKVSGTSAVSSFTAGTTGFTPSTSTTGAVTLAGTLGTANGGTGLTSFTSGGVVYASSSSALTTGSALSFNGTDFFGGTNTYVTGRFYAQRSSSSLNLPIAGYTDGSAGAILTGAKGDIVGFGNAGGDGVIFANNNTEQMRLTSTGLGIGTSSPAYKLDLYTTAQFSGRWGNATRAGYFYADSGGPGIFNTAAYGGEGVYFHAGSNYTAFLTNSSERMRITSAGNVGIGTSSPNYNLEVLNSSNPSIAVTSTSASLYSYYAGIAGTVESYLYTFGQSYSAVYPAGCTALSNNTYGIILNATNASGILRFQTNNTERARVSAAGGFSVGTTSDPGAGAIYATGAITAFFSDKRLKTVSGKIENALDKVAKLSGVYYTFNDTAKSFGYDSDEEQVGVIAQEVEAVLPQIVKAAPFDLDENNNSKSGENYKTVQYDKLVPLLIEAINELQAKVKLLENK